MSLPLQAPARWCATCAYDGGRFHGWQSQTNAVGVQDVIEEALGLPLELPADVRGQRRAGDGRRAVHLRLHEPGLAVGPGVIRLG